ncbi:hypothetical protein KNHN1_23880 [Pseudomonas guariconensis]|uniref:hypothetical protein n=1 Tax=Pseudomonas guariconensis TaxID=1288410 RepID=UPI0036F19AB1
MPTENRSSNTEMVSDSEMTECQFHNNCGGWCETRRELEHNLCEHCLEAHDEEMASPVQQRQGEPVAYIEAADLRDIACGSPWGGTVWGRQSREPYPPRVPVYTHADPGEIERLRKENARLRLNISEMNEDARIRDGQIAEREALLRIYESFPGYLIDHCEGDTIYEESLQHWLADHIKSLPASAEPSAAVEIDHDALVAAVCVLRSQGLGNLAAAVEEARAALERKPS